MADSYYFFALFLRLPFPPRLRVFSLIWSLARGADALARRPHELCSAKKRIAVVFEQSRGID